MSLVELMVAMAIGLAILASVAAIFVSTKSNYVTQESASRLQETARFATHFIMKDLRLAGHYGCHSDTASVRSRLAGAPARFNPANPIEGNEAGTTRWYPSDTAIDFPTTGTAVTALAAGCPNIVGGRCTGSDAITVRFADPDTQTAMASDMAGTASAINVTSASGISAGNIIVVSDCSTADIVQATAVTGANISHAAGGGNPGNSDANLSRTYFIPPVASTTVMRYAVHRYYIGTGRSGHPALFRQNALGSDTSSVNTVVQEMVEGVEDMQVLYGRDTNGDNQPNAYLEPNNAALSSTATNWASVSSVRILLTVRPIADPNVRQSSATAATGVTPKIFTTTVVLRNSQ